MTSYQLHKLTYCNITYFITPHWNLHSISFQTFTLPSTFDISNTYISNVNISYVTLSPQIWNLETLKLWKLHLNFSLFVLAPSEFDVSNVDISHITLSPQIWNTEALKPLLQIFAVCSSPLNLTFRMLTFRMLTYSTLLYHEVFLLSKTKCAVLKYEMCRFLIRKRVHFKYENPEFSKKRNVSFSHTKNASFSNTKMCSFQIRKCITFKYGKCLFFKYENVPFF